METKNKIESMVELRAFAVEKAIECYQISGYYDQGALIRTAKDIVDYIKGDAELPKVQPSLDKTLYDFVIKMMDEKERERTKDFANIDPNFLVKDGNS